MEAKLTINGEDFAPWLKEGGLRQTEVIRKGRSIVTLDGTDHRAGIVKRHISASLVELRDETWYRLLAALQDRPAQVGYLDDSAGETQRLFHVSNPVASAKTVRGGHTYFSGATLELEEM